jgi:hypothetical protein
MRNAPPKRLRGAFALLALLACTGAQAQAVRKCQVDGRVVFQASPCGIEARVATAAPPPAAADNAAAPKKKTLADLLRERDAAERGRSQPPEFQGDGANVLRSRMGAV